MELEEIIASKFPNIKPKIHQIEALQYLAGLEKCDVVLNLPVGNGKSLVYQIFPFIREVVMKKMACSLVITALNTNRPNGFFGK